MKRQRRDSGCSLKGETTPEQKNAIWRAHEDCIVEGEGKPHSRDANSPTDSVHSRISDDHDRSIDSSCSEQQHLPKLTVDSSHDKTGIGGSSHSDVKKSANLELLCRLFPHMKRSVLQLILQGCNEDATQAIEQVLNNHSTQQQQHLHAAVKQQTNTQLLHSAYLTATTTSAPQPPAASAPHSSLKSAFSPISTFTTNPAALTALRYPYPPTTRGLPIGFPYPPGIFPGLASLGYNYNAMAAAVSGGQKPSAAFTGYPPYANPYSTSPDK